MNTRTQFRHISFSLFVAVTVVNILRGGSSGYMFTVNGDLVEPVHYSLEADTSVFAPGDVIYVGNKHFNYGGIFMTLGEEKDCRFVTIPPESGGIKDNGLPSPTSLPDGRVFLQLPDGQRKVVAASVTSTFLRRAIDPNEQTEGKNRAASKRPLSNMVTVNPLDTMSPEEIHGLWGIYLNNWPEGIEQKLAHVNTERVCITVSDYGGVPIKGSPYGHAVFPPLPPNIRYLVVEEGMSPGLRDFSHFSRFHDLVFLKFESFPREPLDAGLICQNVGMRYLDISGCGIPNYQKLASLTEMRFLNITRCQEIDNLEFVRDMHQLRTLFMGLTKISSLSPLDNSDSIREIHAGMTGVRNLPKGTLGSLRTMNLISSKVDAQSVARFRKDHPACIVQHGWAESLRNALQGATRLRVRTGGTCHRQLDQEKTLAEIAEQNEVKRFLDGIHIDEDKSNFSCACCGNPTFEFYAGDQLLAMVGYHHSQSLRWAGGQWPSDALLTGSSQDFVVSWLANNGVDGPRREQEEKQKQRDEQARRQRRYREIIPEQTLQAAIEARSTTEISWANDTLGEKRQKLMAEAFQKHEKDAQAGIQMYLRILGVMANGHWNYYDYYEPVIIKHLLPRFKGPPLAQAAIEVMKDDEAAMGAARWFFGEEGWRNLDEPDRVRILPQLAKLSLQHQDTSARKKTMVALMHINSDSATTLLRSVLSRPDQFPKESRKTNSGWKIDFGDGDALWSGEYSDAPWAALCLAKLGDLQSLAVIERLTRESQGKDKELAEKALQLLGEKDRKTPADNK